MFTHLHKTRSPAPSRRSHCFGVERLEDRRLLSAESLINLDLFRADPRFDGIDGSGFASVIIDTGADLDHPFFGPDADGDNVADRIVFNWDFADGDADARDASGTGHGTHVTSIVGSEDPTYPGMAPGGDIIVLKVFRDGERSADLAVIESALRWVENNVSNYNIASVNLSLGSGNFSDPQTNFIISDEIRRLAEQDVIVVAASGNLFHTEDSTPGVSYPAADPNSLAVGAVWADNHGMQVLEGAIDFTTFGDRVSAYSQRDPQLTDILAPGGLISGAKHDGGVSSRRGTSMAAPHISGVAVLAQQLAHRELGRRLTLDEFRELLASTGAAVHDGDDENDNVTNTGADYRRVDVLNLGQAILVDPGLPTITIDSATVTEGDDGTTNAVFTVRLSFINDVPISVDFSTIDGTARAADGDYLTSVGAIAFVPGGSVTQTITVPVQGDVFDEPDETFRVVLTGAVGAVIARAEGTATIVNDDDALSWHNPGEARDVNNDGLISGLDALIIINQLNDGGTRMLPDPPEPRTPWFFYDVSNDGLLSGLDALIVINWINDHSEHSLVEGGDGDKEDINPVAAAPLLKESGAAAGLPSSAWLSGKFIAGQAGSGTHFSEESLFQQAASGGEVKPSEALLPSAAATGTGIQADSVTAGNTRAAAMLSFTSRISSARPRRTSLDPAVDSVFDSRTETIDWLLPGFRGI